MHLLSFVALENRCFIYDTTFTSVTELKVLFVYDFCTTDYNMFCVRFLKEICDVGE